MEIILDKNGDALKVVIRPQVYIIEESIVSDVSHRQDTVRV